MERANRLLLTVAGVTAVLLTVQLVLINEMSATYLGVAAEEELAVTRGKATVFEELAPLPVVLMHGMGDAAGNAANVQLGDSIKQDVENTFFVTMDNQTAMFAKVVQADPQLANGFNAAGFSQVLKQCIPRESKVCHRRLADGLVEPFGWMETHYRPYLLFAERIAQANYFRDPLRIEDYLKHGIVHAEFLPDLNNEKVSVNQSYKDNFVKLENLVLIRANRDTQVFPKESEWFGAYQDADPYKHVLGFNETKWYLEDSFGLRTLDQAGKVHFLSTDGNHLQFSMEFLLGVVDKYFGTPTISL
ncbi:hypothetical protein BBJ28_00023944 [Nothophytophthora sp. Chile5]|nr:hypothetical protein BBJ28_00023944 [Nothophytophthora sp. Chile5]